MEQKNSSPVHTAPVTGKRTSRHFPIVSMQSLEKAFQLTLWKMQENFICAIRIEFPKQCFGFLMSRLLLHCLGRITWSSCVSKIRTNANFTKLKQLSPHGAFELCNDSTIPVYMNV